MRVIYVDVLFVMNFFITFLLLLLTSKLMKYKENMVRLTISSAIGGAYSLIILVPNLTSVESILSKIFIAFFMIWAAFGIISIKRFLLTIGVFLFTNFLFLGVMSGLWMILKPQGVVIKNSTVYFDIPARFLLLLALVAYLVGITIIRIYDRRTSKKEIFDLIVEKGGKSTHLYAFADSGNNLREPFSAYPVIVAKKAMFKNQSEERIVPFETVGGTGMMTAFKPDKVTVGTSGKQIEIENVYIALSDNMSNDDYSAIINPKIIS